MEELTAYDGFEADGKRKRSHRILLRQGRTRFGPSDTATESALVAIKDLDRLERLADAILTAKSWQGLLATP